MLRRTLLSSTSSFHRYFLRVSPCAPLQPKQVIEFLKAILARARLTASSESISIARNDKPFLHASMRQTYTYIHLRQFSYLNFFLLRQVVNRALPLALLDYTGPG